MHMVNDKGEAIYYNLVHRCLWTGPGAPQKPPFHPGAAGGALPCPAWFPARLTAIFSGGKIRYTVTTPKPF